MGPRLRGDDGKNGSTFMSLLGHLGSGAGFVLLLLLDSGSEAAGGGVPKVQRCDSDSQRPWPCSQDVRSWRSRHQGMAISTTTTAASSSMPKPRRRRRRGAGIDQPAR